MYLEIPPLFMYTNEPVKLILKSHGSELPADYAFVSDHIFVVHLV